MKKFEYPEIEIEMFQLIDVISTSCSDDCMDFGGCTTQTPGA